MLRFALLYFHSFFFFFFDKLSHEDSFANTSPLCGVKL